MTDRLSPKQTAAVLAPPARITILDGSIRAGKTIASLLRYMRWLKDGAPPGPLGLFGKTRDTVGRNIQDVIAEIAPGAISYTRGSSRCRILGRQHEVIGASDARSEGRVRGLTLAGWYGDEISLWPEGFFIQALGRMSVPGAQAHATTNPEGPRHWVKVKYLDRIDDPDIDLFHLHFVMDDNPALTEDFKRNTAAEFTGLFHARFIRGLWVAAEGAIYSMLDDTLHAAPALPVNEWEGRYVAGWVGLDYGTSNPTHAVLIVHDRGHELVQPRLHAVAEWRHDGRTQGQLTDAQISRRLMDWLGPLAARLPTAPLVALDPSAASLRVQMRADGWPGLRAADNRVAEGISVIQSLVQAGRLVIDHKACPHLWDELVGYVWDPKATDRGEDLPLKVNDHGPDGLRYGGMAARRVWRPWLPTLAETVEQLPDAA